MPEGHRPLIRFHIPAPVLGVAGDDRNPVRVSQANVVLCNYSSTVRFHDRARNCKMGRMRDGARGKVVVAPYFILSETSVRI
jgi:hypothetical protein